MLNLPGGVKINGCLSIKRFAKGEKIAIAQHEMVTLNSSFAGKKKDEVIIKATRNGIEHTIIVAPFPKGENLYKVIKFSPTPVL